MNPRVSELLTTINQAQIELEEIRKNCSHNFWFVGMWSWRIGAYQPSRICGDCQNSIPGITEEESNKCWDDFNGGQKVCQTGMILEVQALASSRTKQ